MFLHQNHEKQIIGVVIKVSQDMVWRYCWGRCSEIGGFRRWLNLDVVRETLSWGPQRKRWPQFEGKKLQFNLKLEEILFFLDARLSPSSPLASMQKEWAIVDFHSNLLEAFTVHLHILIFIYSCKAKPTRAQSILESEVEEGKKKNDARMAIQVSHDLCRSNWGIASFPRWTFSNSYNKSRRKKFLIAQCLPPPRTQKPLLGTHNFGWPSVSGVSH